MLVILRRLNYQGALKRAIFYSNPSHFCSICAYPRVINLAQSAPHIFQNHKDLQSRRYKSKGDKFRQKKEVSESETDDEREDDFMDNVQDKNTKTLKIDVTSMRMDGIIKAGLGLSRNKIEVIFYESKIRLNGEKVAKKSAHISEGDEIDVIKGANVKNPNFLTVARIEVLAITPKEESIRVKLRRFKSLTIENYKGSNSWTQ